LKQNFFDTEKLKESYMSFSNPPYDERLTFTWKNLYKKYWRYFEKIILVPMPGDYSELNIEIC
jgi:hypothetical protein